MHKPSIIAAADRPDGATPLADPRRANSYDFVRFCAASAVLFSHHFDLAGRAEPNVPGYGEDFGELGVEVFFCLSGFLIFRSLQKSPDWAEFAAARILRIFPNLAFVLVTTSVVTFLWFRNTAHLWAHVEYVAGNLLMFVRGVTFVIPGVFPDAVRPAVNEPLWTLPYELWLYAILFLIVSLSGRRTGAMVVSITLVIGLAWGAASAAGDLKLGSPAVFDFVRLGSYFLSGATLAVIWPHVEDRALAIGAAGLIGLILLCILLPAHSILHALALTAAVIGLGSARAMAWFSKGGDASYGMYVFAWPVQQFSLLLIGSFWLSMLAACLVTIAIGYATWHAFERRALSYRGRLAQRLRGGRRARIESGSRR